MKYTRKEPISALEDLKTARLLRRHQIGLLGGPKILNSVDDSYHL